MENDTNQPTDAVWKPLQTFTMATICLIIGVAVGYLVRGSAAPRPAVANTNVAQPAGGPNVGMVKQGTPSLDEMKRMADKQAQPLLTKLKSKPNDAALLNKTALTYKAAHQFDKAAEYFKKSLDSDPKNIAVRDDYASCLYYLGDVDGALAQLQKSLTYDPKHPGTLFNIGMIEWKGKGDVDAAVAKWETILKSNPDFPQKDQVQHLIEAARRSKATVADKQ